MAPRRNSLVYIGDAALGSLVELDGIEPSEVGYQSSSAHQR